MALNEDKIIIDVEVQVDDSKLNNDLKSINKQVQDASKEATLNVGVAIDKDATDKVDSIKRALKALKEEAANVGEGGAGFEKLTRDAGELQKKLDDVNDQLKVSSQDGLNKFGAQLGLIKNKLLDLDFNGARKGIEGLGSTVLRLGPATTAAGAGFRTLAGAIAATGIGALVIAVGYLVTHFDDLKKSGGLLGTTLKSVGDIVNGLISTMTALTDAIGLTAIASQKAADAQIKDQKRVSSSLKSEYEYRLALLKAQGKDTAQFELDELKKTLKEKQDILDGSQKSITGGINKYIETQVKAGAKLTDGYKKWKQDKLDEIDLIKKSIAIKEAEIATSSNKKTETKKSDNRNETAERLRELQELNELAIAKTKEGSLERLKATEAASLKEQQFYVDLSTKQLDDLKISETKRKTIIIQLQNDRLKANIDYYKEEDRLCQLSADEQIRIKEKQIADQAALDKISADNFKQAQEESLKVLRSAQDEYEKSQPKTIEQRFNEWRVSAQKNIDAVADALSTASQMIGELGGVIQGIFEIRINKAENAADREVAALQKTFDMATKGKKLSNIQQVALENKLAQDKYKIALELFNKEEKLRERAFKANKAIQIVQAVIGTAQGVVAALSEPFFPLMIARMALAATTGAVQIGVIASQQFQKGEAPAAPSPISVPEPNLPTQNSSAQGPDKSFQAAQFFGLGGKQAQDSNSMMYQKVYVVESDITGMQKRVNVIEDRAKIG